MQTSMSLFSSPSLRCFDYPTLASTSDTAAALLAAGEVPPFVVTATTQTAGRGQRGRAWESPPGNLYLTYALPRRVDAVPLAGFAAALAVREALTAWVAPEQLRLKWPNDVLLQGRKVAGVLLENRGEGLLVGIGINLVHTPAGATRWPAGCVAEMLTHTVPLPERDAVREALTAPLLRWLDASAAVVCAAWQQVAWGIGTRLTLEDAAGAGQVSGICAGIDADGRLRLQTPEGERLMSGGRIVPDAAGESRPCPHHVYSHFN